MKHRWTGLVALGLFILASTAFAADTHAQEIGWAFGYQGPRGAH